MGDVVIVGAGQAGLACAARLRADGFPGRVTLIGAEPHPPYQRPPLSKDYLLGEIGRDRLLLRPESFYAEHGIDLRTGQEVAALDVAAREVRLVTGGAVPYGDLVLTLGSSPRRLPASIGGALDGVLVMRDVADADRLAPLLVPGRRVLVVGGGYIGLEAAAVCAKRGLTVTLVEMAPRILQRVAAPETSDYFRALHRSHGVTIREGTGLARLLGESHVAGALLSDGTELALDLVLVGVGIAPNARLAESAGIACDDGILVDAFGRTSAAHVWAAGDCARFPHEDRRLRLESVGHAIDQAEAVARNIMEADRPYVPAPWFWSDQYDTKLQIAGLGQGYDAVHVRESGDARSHWYYRGDTLLAVDAMNDPRAYMIAKRLIEAGRSPPPSVVTDPGTDLKALLRG